MEKNLAPGCSQNLGVPVGQLRSGGAPSQLGGVGRKAIHRARQRRPARDAGQDALLEAAGRQAVAISPSSLMPGSRCYVHMVQMWRSDLVEGTRTQGPYPNTLVQVDQILSQN